MASVSQSFSDFPWQDLQLAVEDVEEALDQTGEGLEDTEDTELAALEALEALQALEAGLRERIASLPIEIVSFP